MTKEEFKVMVMLYAANIDGNIHENEVEQMLQESNPTIFEKTRKTFRKISDMDILSCIQENKERFVGDNAAKQSILDEIHATIMADNHLSSIEAHLMRTLRKIL